MTWASKDAVLTSKDTTWVPMDTVRVRMAF